MTGTSKPEAFVDVHHVWSLQLFESCLHSVWTETQLGRGRERSATDEHYRSSVTVQGRNQGVGSSSCCTTRQCRSLWKSTCPLVERLQHARKEARDSKPLDQRLEGCRGALQRASKAKQAAIAQQQAAQAAFEKADADETRIRAELAEPQKHALSQTTQPTFLQTISCKAVPLSASLTDLSRHTCQRPKHLPHKTLFIVFSPSLLKQRRKHRVQRRRVRSATCGWDSNDEDLNIDTPDDVLLDTLKRGSEGDAQEMLRAVRRRIRAKQCLDVPMEVSRGCNGKHSGMTPMTVGKHSYT